MFLNSADNKVTIDFKNYLKSLQSNSTEEFTITYKVKLNENAVLGQTGNKIKLNCNTTMALQLTKQCRGTTLKYSHMVLTF